MVGSADIVSGSNFAKGFAQTAAISARPNFELQFNILQNTVIDRLNTKIEEVTADDGLVNNIDVFLLDSEKKLRRFQSDLGDFIFDNSRNINAAGGLASQLDDLEAALTANNTESFNSILSKINQTVGNTHVSNGVTVGIFIDDGITKLRREGLVSKQEDGANVPATARSDFANDAAAQAAIDAARTQIGTIAEVLVLKAEGAENIRANSDKNLNSVLLQIQAAQVADETEKANEIARLRDEFAQLLNALSLAFESSQAIVDQLSAKLFNPDAVQPGSAVNILL